MNDLVSLREQVARPGRQLLVIADVPEHVLHHIVPTNITCAP